MEGVLWTRSGLLGAMQRRYCVLKGTMLASYSSEAEARRGARPRDVHEVVQAREWDGATALRVYAHALELECLGNAKVQCHAESADDKRRWLLALRHALAEPDRIAQDEIDAAQRQLADDADREQQALARAADAVRDAQNVGGEVRAHEQRMQENAAERHMLEEKLQLAQILLDEARRKTLETREVLLKARQSAHDAALTAGSGEDGVSDGGDAADAPHYRQLVGVERLAAQLEVDANLEETRKQDVDALDESIIALSREFAELFRVSRERADAGQKLRDTAAANLQQAQSAKQLAKLHIESWSTAPSHLDPLAEGYLVCKHPYKPTTHRRYYVLFGNTLCWYKNADMFAALPESPVGVVHVSGVGEWTGKVGATMKVLPHTFSVVTVEGKVLYCSAPTRQSVTTWTTALHIGITMPPLSPHRAVAAKSRRDSFDLMSSMATLSPKKSSGHFQFPPSSSSSSKEVAEDGGRDEAQDDSNVIPTVPRDPDASPTRAELEATVVVEGYLVKKSAFVPVMKKKYCVLKGLRLFIFSSHEAYETSDDRSNSADHEEIQVCSVSDWDGHGALLHYSHGFQIQTLRHQTIFCSAANSDEKDKWVHGIRKSLLKHRERLLSPIRREESMINRARKSILMKASVTSLASDDDGDVMAAPQEPIDEAAAALEEFHALLHEFYAEHNPGKLGDVPMLIERYKQREKALIEHLDRIYGTDVAHDEQVVTLLDKLAARLQQPGYARRKSSGVKSGLVDFVKMAGYLCWNSDRCYCVLSVNKLVRYRTQTHYETEAYDPIESIVISSVYEYPPPVDFVPSASSKNTFFVSYTEEQDDVGHHHHQPQHSLALSSATVEEKLKWMAKIRSGLGFAHANAERSAATTTAATSGSPGRQRAELDSPAPDTLRLKLVEYYKQHNPRKVGEIGALLSYFAGNETQLLADLDATYGTHIAEDPEFAQLVRSVQRREGGRDASSDSEDVSGKDTVVSSVYQYESYLWVKHPILGVAFQKCYCVLSGDTWRCYSSSRQAHADDASDTVGADTSAASVVGRDSTEAAGGSQREHGPLLVDIVVNVHARSVKLQEMNATLSIETLSNGSVLLRADADKLTQDWTQVLRRAADTYQFEKHKKQIEDARSEDASSPRRHASSVLVPTQGPTHRLYTLLVSFYERYNTEKVSEVSTLLHAFSGRERRLLEQIDAIYHTDLSVDPTYTAVLQAIEQSYAAQQQQRELSDEQGDAGVHTSDKDTVSGGQKKILMEGYLTKRGHLIPSMRKRYCVLVGATLEYFATHEDSRNPEIRPHGSFQVEIVGDWQGKTASKTFEHGMELETVDGKSFFCAASTAADKTAWMRAFKHGIAIARAAAASAEEAQEDEVEEEEEGSESERAARKAAFKERLTQFYREANPAKLDDLDVLLTCYARREFALLEAIDAVYGSALAQDASLLALIPPSNAYRRALNTLQFDGGLARYSDSSWKRAQSVHVAMNELTLAFYASREGFKCGAASDKTVTVLAVKDIDRVAAASGGSSSTKLPAHRFAVETTEHVWMYFEAPNAQEQKHWVEVLQAALDAILGQSLLEEETQLLQANSSSDDRPGDRPRLMRRRSSFTMGSSLSGYLLVRLDFASESDNLKKRDAAVAIEERHFVLEHNNQLVVYNGAQNAIAATFTTLSTRAWEPSAAVSSGISSSSSSAPTSPKGDARCRYPFQIITLEQIVLSCSAATDVLRARWIKQIRTGAERVVALEMLHDQRVQVQNEAVALESRDSSSRSRGGDGVGDDSGDGATQSSNTTVTGGDSGAAKDAPQAAMKGYLEYKTSSDPGLPGPSTAMREGYFLVSSRAMVTIYADEGAFLRSEKPLVSAQAAELISSSRASIAASPAKAAPSSPAKSPSKSARRHLHKLFGDDSSASAEAAGALDLVFTVQTRDESAKFVHLFPASSAQQATWIGAFRSGINLLKGEELLADEKFILHLEQTHDEEVKGRESLQLADAGAELSATSSPGATLDGFLTPWRVAFGTSRATVPLFYVLTGCRLRAFASRDDVPENLTAPRTEGKAAACGDLLDVDVVSVSDWEVPSAATKSRDDTSSENGEGTGFRVEGTTPSSSSREIIYFSASSFELKNRWVRALKNELDFALAEMYLDEDAKEFARQVAAHVADVSGGSGDAARKRRNTTIQQQHTEGYVRRKALEKHDLVAVETWHPTYSVSLGGSGSSGSRFGFRVENEAGGYLECTVSTEEEQAHWMAAVTAAVDDLSLHTSNRVMLRDPALPFIPGAAMEGYLKLKEKKTKLALFWKTRYCAVIGTQWLLYETQEQATAGASERDDGAAGVPPLAVYEIVQVAPWARPERTSERILDTSDELLSRGFTVHVSPDGIRIDCKAQSSLERKRWLNAMEDQLAKSSQASTNVLEAMQRHQDKESAKAAIRTKFSEVTSDARRQSTFLRQALQLATIDDDEHLGSGSSSYDDSDGDDGHDGRTRPRSGSDFIDRSPESSPMRRKTPVTVEGSFANTQEADDDDGKKPAADASSVYLSVTACFARCFSRTNSEPSKTLGVRAKPAGRSITPLGVPGFPVNAEVWSRKYRCDYYNDDGYTSDSDW